MAVATYAPLNTTTLSTTQSAVTFSSISQAYTDLVLIVSGGITSSGDIWLRMNGDTATTYSRTRVYGNGGVATTDRNTASSSILVNVGTSGAAMLTTINILNYTNTTTYKTAISRYASDTYAGASAGLWRSTAAITSISLTADAADTFTSGTVFTLYGIKAA
jgi:hypothetical protein